MHTSRRALLASVASSTTGIAALPSGDRANRTGAQGESVTEADLVVEVAPDGEPAFSPSGQLSMPPGNRVAFVWHTDGYSLVVRHGDFYHEVGRRSAGFVFDGTYEVPGEYVVKANGPTADGGRETVRTTLSVTFDALDVVHDRRFR